MIEQNGLRVKISDNRFYYNCAIEDISTIGFKARGLPMQFDEKAASVVNVLTSYNVRIKVSVKVCSVTVLPDDQGKEVIFLVSDPPRLWKEYVNTVLDSNMCSYDQEKLTSIKDQPHYLV